VTTASPGQFHIFDISTGLLTPKLLKTFPVGNGAHHVAFSPDERLAFVQNNFLGLPGMGDGSVTVIDLEKRQLLRAWIRSKTRDSTLTLLFCCLNGITMQDINL